MHQLIVILKAVYPEHFGNVVLKLTADEHSPHQVLRLGHAPAILELSTVEVREYRAASGHTGLESPAVKLLGKAVFLAGHRHLAQTAGADA